MNYHPDKKQLIDYIVDPSTRKASEIANHISNCEDCKETVRSLSDILIASDNSSLAPPPRVKNRVLGLLNEIENKNNFLVNLKSIPRLLFRPAVLASIILIAALSIFIYTMQKPQIDSKPITFILSRTNGYILYNNDHIKTEQVNINSGIIKTEEQSSAIINANSVLSLKIAENSELDIIEAWKNIDQDNTKYYITINLKLGTVFVISNHNVDKKLIISTQHAIFEALGTSFIISSNNLSTTLSLLDGIIRVTSNHNGKTLILNKDEGCIANSFLKKIKINTENEKAKFNILFSKNKDTFISGEQKSQPKDKIKDLTDNNENAKQKEGEISSRNQQYKDEIRKNKTELRDETKQIQREMRNNRRSGKRSPR